MRVYSPSQTVKFMECPATWILYKQGWRPKYMSKGNLAAILGTAFHNAIAEHYRAERQGEPEIIGDIAYASVLKDLGVYEELGFLCGTRDLDLKAALPLKAKSLTTKFLTHKKYSDPVPQDWEYSDPELILPEHGHARIDLVVSPRDNIVAPLDWKVKLRMDPRYEWKTKQEWAYSWQFMHYAWALSQYSGKPVQEFYVCWVSLEPGFRTELLDYYIDPELMQLWENSAKQVWALMAAMQGDNEALATMIVRGKTLYPFHTFQWFTRWGRDEFTDAILDHRLHSDLMKQDYINIGGRRI